MDKRRKKLRFRAWHRGFRELDLILGPFADTHLARFSDKELDQFSALLDAPDWDTYAWITGQSDIPGEMQGPVVQALRDFCRGSGPVAGKRTC